MRLLKQILIPVVLIFSSLSSAVLEAQPGKVSGSRTQVEQPKPGEKFRGWEHLVRELLAAGAPLSVLRSVYQDKRMQLFNPIYFKVKPKEASAMYTGFLTPKRLKMGRECLAKHSKVLANAERRFEVPKEVLTAIALVESNCGTITGKSRIVERLSRLAGLFEPNNVKRNYRSLVESGEKVTLKQVQDRAEYLKQLFLPELLALFRYAKRERLDILEVRGSNGGAIGIVQFLPGSIERFGVDGNGDGVISLFNHADAFASAANFIASSGWDNSLKRQEKRLVLKKYNNSDPYVDTVLQVAERLGAKI